MKRTLILKLVATIYMIVDNAFWAWHFPGIGTWVVEPLLNLILLAILWTRKWENT